MKIAAVDLDGVAVDNRARAAWATRADGSMDWAALFDPDLVTALDEPIPAALAALQDLVATGNAVWYVTSRPDTCNAATIAWLASHGYPDAAHVVCRPPFQKTVEFKAEAIAYLQQTQGPVALFVDDRESNRAAVGALGIAGLEIADHL